MCKLKIINKFFKKTWHNSLNVVKYARIEVQNPFVESIFKGGRPFINRRGGEKIPHIKFGLLQTLLQIVQDVRKGVVRGRTIGQHFF